MAVNFLIMFSLEQSDLIVSEIRKQSIKVGKKVLYVGPNASLYLQEFFPRHFTNKFYGLNWSRESSSLNRQEVKKKVLKLLNTGEFESLILQLDYDPIFYSNELVQIGNLVNIVGIFGDDASLVYFSAEISLYCDLVLTTDPLQIPRYESLGVKALPHLYDISSKRFPNQSRRRDIDVLIYGTSNKGRQPQIDYIKREFSDWKIVDITRERVNFFNLIVLLNRSRVTVNWNYVWEKPIVNNFRDDIASQYIQLKGRVFEAALCGCLPISTYCASTEKILKGSLPTFRTNSELKEQLETFLVNEQLRHRVVREVGRFSRAYLSSLETRIDLANIERKGKKRSTSRRVDEVVATYHAMDFRFEGAWNNMSRQLSNLASVKWKRVIWRFLFQQGTHFLLQRLRENAEGSKYVSV